MKKKPKSDFIQNKIKFEKNIIQENNQLSSTLIKEYAEKLNAAEISDEMLQDILMEAKELIVKLKNWKLQKPSLGFIIAGNKELALKNFDRYTASLDGIIEECTIRIENRSIRKSVSKLKSPSELTAFEIALKHWYLERAGIESYSGAIEIASKYKGIKNSKNIELAFNDIVQKRKKANLKQLKNILNSLKDYPIVQKAIQNDLDKLQ